MIVSTKADRPQKLILHNTPQIGIVCPVHNGIDNTKRFWRSLSHQTIEDFILYLVDDGSTDGTAEWVRKLDDDRIVLINADGDRWWGGAVRLGLRKSLACAHKLTIIANNDVTFTSETIETALYLAINNNSPFHSSVYNTEGTPMCIGSRLVKTIFGYPVLRRVSSSDKNEEYVDFATARFLVIPTEILRKSEYCEPRLRHYGADYEWTWQLRQNGHPVRVTRKFTCILNTQQSGKKVGRLLDIPRLLLSKRSPFMLQYRYRFALNAFGPWPAIVYVLLTPAVVVWKTLIKAWSSKPGQPL